jgi:WD40 repeat protein
LREKLVEEIAMPANLKTAAAYQARSTFIPVTGDSVGTPSPASIFRKVAACLGIVPKIDKNTNLTSFGVSADGLAAGFVIDLQHVYKCDLETGKPTKLLSMVRRGTSRNGFATMEFSPNKRLLTTVVSKGMDDWNPVALEMLTGRVVQQWNLSEWDQRFALGGRWLVFWKSIVRTDNWSTVYSIKDGQILAVSLDGRLAGIVDKNRLKVLDLASKKILIEIPTRDNTISHLSFSPDARRLVASGHTVRVFELADSLDGPSVSDPALLWGQWQRKLGLTVDQNDEPVPVWQVGFKELRGAATVLASE